MPVRRNPSYISGRLVMVVTVKRLEPGHCTSASYDSHAWWGSRGGPMSDVTSLLPCAQRTGPPAQPCRAVSCPLRPSQTHTHYPTHRATRAMGGVAWSGVVWSGHTRGCSPGRFLLNATCNTSQAAGILESINDHRLLHPLFPSTACHLNGAAVTHTHTPAQLRAKGSLPS